jgi:hypothetical protein
MLSTACQILTFISNGLTACCNEFFAGPKCLFSSLQPFVYIFGVHSTKLVFKLTAEKFTACNSLLITQSTYLFISSTPWLSCTFGTSCPCHHVGTFSSQVKVPCTIGGTACSHLLPLSCTWKTYDEVLTLVSSKFEGRSLFGQSKGHMDCPPAPDKSRGAEQPAIISTLSLCISGPRSRTHSSSALLFSSPPH